MPTDNTIPTDTHEHLFDTENGYRKIGETIMLYCACRASKLFAPVPEDKKQKQRGKLLRFPAAWEPLRGPIWRSSDSTTTAPEREVKT